MDLFGETFLGAEMTVAGKHFDSFFFAESAIKEAERLAAQLYSADGTLFVTVGTTAANQIAIHALIHKGSKVILDKSCHQSIHFTLQALGARIDYLAPAANCEHSGKSYWAIDELLQKTLSAQEAGDPYHLIVLNAQSYDGVVYDIPGIIEYLLDRGVNTRNFLIDEAWGSANYFHKELCHHAAMNITPLLQRYPDITVVATHSAHKSLSCLRQASMIHFRGSDDLLERLKIARFRIHTTSPSYPILASLDLARAQMQIAGKSLVQHASTLAEVFTESIRTDQTLSSYKINQFTFPEQPFPYVLSDPTKVSLNITNLGITEADVRDLLYLRYGIYVNRITENSILFNFHIGVSPKAVDKLLGALRELQLSHAPNWPTPRLSETFIIPYPPGVPLIVPGEPMTPLIRKKIQELRRSGIHVVAA